MPRQSTKKPARKSPLTALLAAVARSQTAEQTIAMLLKTLGEALRGAELELFLYDAEKHLGFLVAAFPPAKARQRVVNQDERAEVFLKAAKRRPTRSRAAGRKSAQVFAIGAAEGLIGALVCRPTADADKQLTDWAALTAALLTEPLKRSKIYQVVHFAVTNLRQMAAEERQKVLRLLAGSFSHILNQPLTSIVGYVELLRKSSRLAPAEAAYLRKIEEESARLNQLLRGMERIDPDSLEDYVGSAQIIKPMAGGAVFGGGEDISLFFELIHAFSKLKGREKLLASFAKVLKKRFPLNNLYFLQSSEGEDDLQTAWALAEGRLTAGQQKAVKEVWQQAGREQAVFYHPAGEGAQVCAVIIPLCMQQSQLGVLYVALKEVPAGGRFTAAEEKLILALAGQLALCLLDRKLFSEAQYWRAYLEELIECANALIFALDGSGNISVYNRPMEYLFGYSKEELLGKGVGRLFQDDVALARFKEAQAKVLSGQAVYNFELNLQTRDGQMLPAVFNFTAVPDPEGAAVGMVAIGQDLSEVRSLEQQIIQSEKLAYFGKMSAAFVHELNNPLTSITVYTEYLLRRAEALKLEEDSLEKLKKILGSAERIQQFTQDLTSFARPAARESIEELHVLDLLREAIEFTEHQTKKAGIQLVVEAADGLPSLWAVRSQLQQVFVNLIVNAAQAVSPKGIVRLTAADHDTDTILVTVEDNGAGVEPMFLSRIFDPFFSTKSRSEGTGLGLSIVKRIVDNHLGTIRVSSVRDQGTCFSIFLPKLALKEKLLGGRRKRAGKLKDMAR